MSHNVNFAQGWCEATNAGSTHIKVEPPNNEPTNNGFKSIDMKSNIINNNNNTMLMAATGSRNGDSNPTSPHSAVSDESINHSNLYFNEMNFRHEHSLLNPNAQRPLGFNPLTPPGYPNACLRSTADVNLQDTLLPTTPSRRFAKESVFNSNSLTPPGDQTPPKSDGSEKDGSDKDGSDNENENENGSLSDDESKTFYGDFQQEIAMPKVNSHGKIKTHKCKHCAYVGTTKKEFWEHQRQHIKPERQILCKLCPFVTEFKHHYEYHVRNHDGAKPFKCTECNYSCVNKSMLNSHLKSHSDVYQYRCQNCSYATKYVHSLKLHLRKYEHQPAVPLDPEGHPDAAPIIDVYGTRRGPKKRTPKKPNGKQEQKKPNKSPKKENSSKIIPQNSSISEQFTQQRSMSLEPLSAYSNFAALPNQSFFQNQFPNQFPNMQQFMLQLILQQQQQQLNAQLSPPQFRNGARNFDCDEDDDDLNMENEPLTDINDELDICHPESPTSSVPNSNPNLNNSHMSKNGDEDNQHTSSDSQMPKLVNTSMQIQCLETNSPDNDTKSPKTFDCKHCMISFQDDVMHNIHMGYHRNNDVFTCNMCGEKCSGPIPFFLHIAKKEH